ncbi:inositol 2-dehydrogenase [Streptomyces canus]|uniref:Inositol 2-dehydrogenase n=2 Tax=Streptomyces TaxID=1883 RepID=A0A101RNV4_9ACTN|nr:MULTISPECIES: Gfo/Idh/MocA family oxidoreductase [Streptomyces]KUN59094.1 inositol 2-dehydrogenase [Streptomyces canus]MDI5912930.1 Gfo/Idh/MocA family oxidoreductase [Streptomyces sp. 12257]
MTVRVGVIGAGVMGADHVRLLHGFVSSAEVVAVADVDGARARAVASGVPGALVSPDAWALIADSRVDAVVVASHDSTHAELTVAAVRAGKPVLCEKPLAPTVAECVEVVREDDKAGGGLVSVGFMRRFDPAYVALKAALGEGRCGRPRVVHCVSRGVTSAPGAVSEFSVTGSSIHEFDVVPWLLDSPVTAVSWHAPEGESAPGLRDPQVMLLHTADGTLTTLETFLNARYGYEVRCEIAGERGALRLADPALVVSSLERNRSTGYPADWRPRFAEAYRLELQAWIDAVVAGRPSPLASARAGLTASAVAEAVIASMRDGGRTAPVSLPAV